MLGYNGTGYTMKNTKILRFLSVPSSIAVAVLALACAAVSLGLVSAQSFTQGYGTSESLQRGMIVQINKDDTTKVSALSKASQDQMHGVVVDPSDAQVSIRSDDTKVFVATTGRYPVLVSNQNGTINSGDYITISSISGIGMKAGTTNQLVIGRALAGFNGKQNVISTAEVTDATGQKQTVSIARIDVDVKVSQNPMRLISEQIIPAFLRRAAESVADKPVSAVRVYVSVAVFFISTVLAGSLMYAGIKSSIVSIGRNPLSRKSVTRAMFQVIISGLIIFITGLFGVYLILKL